MPSVNAFPTTVNVATKTTTMSNLDTSVTYSVSVSNVPAMITDASASLQLLYQQRNITIDKVIYLNQPGITLSTGDILQVGSSNYFCHKILDVSGTGRIFEILAYHVGNIVYEE